MIEQEESVKTSGSVMIPENTFVRWMEYHEHVVAATGVSKYLCAAVIMQYAKDQQGSDIRGGVAGDSAWELCCRLLLEMDTCYMHSMQSTDLAQLIVLWLEAREAHASHRELIYQGMYEDLTARGRDLQNDNDVAEMQCYWVKMSIHRELDALREDCAARGEELPVELEVEGGLVEGEEQSLTLEAEREPASVVRALGTEGQRGAADEEWEAGEAQAENIDSDHEYGEGAECLGGQAAQISSATGHRATALSLSASVTGSAAALDRRTAAAPGSSSSSPVEQGVGSL